jgi:tRNA nucleotidyltransferase/poly(A) polymerase
VLKKQKHTRTPQTLSFPYKGIRINFEGDVDISSFANKDRLQLDLSDAIISDLCNRDFTINMFAYNVCEDTVEDILGVINDLKNKTIKTFFNSEAVIMSNPMIIMRALKLQLKYGFEIDANLKRAMINKCSKTF